MSTEARTGAVKQEISTSVSLALFTLTTGAILLAYYFPLLWQGLSFYASDHNFYFEPFARFIGESYRKLNVPLWNPYVYCGMPQIAVPSPGVFYPPNLIWAFTSYAPGLGLTLTFHQLLAGVGAFLLITSFGWGAPAAFMTGTICAFCGYMFSLNANHTLVTTASWIPINLWLMNKIKSATGERQTYLFVILSSFAVALLIAAGRPEISVIGLIVVCLFALLQSNIWSSDEAVRRAGISRLNWQVLGLFIAALLVMPAVLPVAEWLAGSPRAKGMDVKWVFTWSANWYDLISFIFAQPFGDLQTLGSTFAGIAASRANYLPYVPSTLIGPVAATLAVWALGDRGWRGKVWLVLLTVGTFIVMIGSYTVVIPRLFALVPAATLFRYPIKLAVLLAFCLAVLAGRGLYSAYSGKLGIRTWTITLILWAASLSLAQWMYTLALFHRPIPFPTLAGNASAQIVLGLALSGGSAVGLAVVAVGWLMMRKKISPRSGVVILNAFAIISLIVPAFSYRPRVTTSDFFNSPSWLVDQMTRFGWKNDPKTAFRLQPIYDEPVQKPDDYKWTPKSTFNENYYHYCRQLLLPQINMDYGVSEPFGYEAGLTLEYEDHLVPMIHRIVEEKSESSSTLNRDLPLAQFCRSSATGFVSEQVSDSKRDMPTLDRSLFDSVIDSETMNLRIYRVRNPLPRAFVAYTWHWMKNHQDALRTTLSPSFTHFDPAQPVVEPLPKDGPTYIVAMPKNYQTGSQATAPQNADLNADKTDGVLTQSGLILPGKNLPPTVSKEQDAAFLKDTPEHISISANLTKPGFLVLSDRYYPGWKAKVDGIPAPIFRANALFRSVYLPKGGHLIDFDYEPESLMIGLYFGAVGLTLDSVLLFLLIGPSIGRAFKRMAGQPV
jgi:hypothetical protein